MGVYYPFLDSDAFSSTPTGISTEFTGSYNPNAAATFDNGLTITGISTFSGTVSANSFNIPQNSVGTTYGNGVSSSPTYKIQQTVGDNDGWRIYGEAPSTNDVKMIFEIIDDIETGDTWVFRNKKTYSPYNATEPFIIQGNGNVTATGNVTAFSDITLKKDIEAISNALDKVTQIRGVTYERTDEEGLRQAGVIAQEVEEVLPEVVTTNEKGIKSVAYGNMVGLLIEAIKDLKGEVETLKDEIKSLKQESN